MSYIGNQPLYAAFLTDQFSGNNSTTSFSLSAAPANTASILVAVSGVLQDPTTYALVGTSLNFSAAPPTGTGNISVRYLGIPAAGVTTTAYRTVTEFTATAGQTTFTPPSYTVGFIAVYRNGVRLGSADYTASNGTTVVLASGANSGDLVVTESFYVSSVVNAIANMPGAVVDSNITSMDASKLLGRVPGANAPSGCVLQVVQTLVRGTLTTTATSLVAMPGFTATITPTSATSKILVMVKASNLSQSTQNICTLSVLRNGSYMTATGNTSAGGLAELRYAFGSGGGGHQGGSDDRMTDAASLDFLDSPASTSPQTYALYWYTTGGTGYLNQWALNADKGSVSSITLMEIAA